MKTNESLLHKGMRTIVQSALHKEPASPAICAGRTSRIAPKSPCRSRRIRSKTSQSFLVRRIPEV